MFCPSGQTRKKTQSFCGSAAFLWLNPVCATLGSGCLRGLEILSGRGSAPDALFLQGGPTRVLDCR